MAAPTGVQFDAKGGFYTPDGYGTYSYNHDGGQDRGVQLPGSGLSDTDPTGQTTQATMNFLNGGGFTPGGNITTQNLSGNQPSVLQDNGKTYTTTPNAPTTVATTTQPGGADTTVAPAAPAAPAPAAQTAPTPVIPTPGVPVAGFKPGQTGPEVKSLQDMLVAKGFMTAAQEATGPGIFGPKTQAALAAYQANSGLPASTGNSNPADAATPSPYTNAPATPTTPAKSAVQQVMDDYTAAYTALGLGDIKTQYQDFVKQEADLAAKKSLEVQDINNNPWYTQAEKDRSLTKLDNKYADQEKILTNKVSLLDSLYKQGQQEVENIVSKTEAITMEQQKEAAALAQKKQDAIDALAKRSPSEIYGSGSIGEYNFAVSQGYKGSFTQYQNEDANRKAKAAGGTTTPKTLAERNAQDLADLQASIEAGNKTPSGAPLKYSDGYLTADGLKYILSQAPAKGLTTETVIKSVANQLAPDTDKKGNDIPGTVSSHYGLTAAQKKLITG